MEIRLNSELGPLSDARCFTARLNIAGRTRESLEQQLRMMLAIRLAEEAIADLVIEGSAKCPCHLGIGQEAVAVGVSTFLKASDRVFGAHRSHAHYLALGGSINALMAEVLGKVTGCSGGMGGSMHLYGRDVGFHGSVPIVAGTIPIAVGAGLAAQMDGGTDLAVTYFGDGASEEGILHESLNIAAQFKLPVLFVCENNLFSSHLDIALRQPSDRISRFADAHRVKSRLVDGNDVIAVANAAQELCDGIRNGLGPAFLEAVTYRWRGHVGPNEDIDVGVRRKTDDVNAWKQRDPIRRLKDAMVGDGLLAENDYQKLCVQIKKEVMDAVAYAKRSDYPPTTALLDLVYAKRNVR